MAYIAHIPTINDSISAPYEVPELLNKFNLYEHEERAQRYLFAVGGNESDNFTNNWDIYTDKKGTLYSIARPGTGCRGSYFGDVNHIKNLIRQGYFKDTLTQIGVEMMKGRAAADVIGELNAW